MLDVTKDAKQQLRKSLDGARDTDVSDKCFRIVPATHEPVLTLQLAKPRPDDTIYEHDGRTVLALPRKLKRICEDKSLRVNADGRLFLS